MLWLLIYVNAVVGAVPCEVSVQLNSSAWPIKKQYLGCHSDSGYGYQPSGLYAQLLWGGSFERGLWPSNNEQRLPASMKASLTLTSPRIPPVRMKRGRNSAGSMLVNATGTGKVTAGNRGLGNQGLRLEAGRPYEGYFFVRAPNGTTREAQLASADVQAVVTLDDYTSSPPATLASQLLPIPSPALRGEWVMVNFSSLIPHTSTTCQFLPQPNSSEAIEPCLSAKEHACIQCG